MTLQDDWIARTRQAGDSAPPSIASASPKKLWWQCERGHAWQAPAYSVKSGSGCPYCAGKRAIPGETDLATTHPQLLQYWHPGNTLRPTELTAGSHKKVWWICGKGHEWEAKIQTLTIMESGCPYCAGKRAIPGETDLATLRPDLLSQWDDEKNTLRPTEVLPSAHDRVWWKCPLGHSYEAVIFSRTKENGTGCPYCAGRKALAGFNDLASLKPELAKQWYQPLNGDLKPEDVTPGSNKKVWWQCSEGHVWQAFVFARAKPNGTGCPVCAGNGKPAKKQAEKQRLRKAPAFHDTLPTNIAPGP